MYLTGCVITVLIKCVKYSGIDEEFEKLLANIFGRDFIETYKLRRPSGWTDLMVAFESRKRSANPNKNHPLNVCLPFSFIEQHKKLRVSEDGSQATGYARFVCALKSLCSLMYSVIM